MDDVVVMVSNDEFVIPEVSLTLVVLSEKLVPVGPPLIVRSMVPLKVFRLDNLITLLLLLPWSVATTEGLGVMEKSGSPTATVTTANRVTVPRVPVTFTE